MVCTHVAKALKSFCSLPSMVLLETGWFEAVLLCLESIDLFSSYNELNFSTGMVLLVWWWYRSIQQTLIEMP